MQDPKILRETINCFLVLLSSSHGFGFEQERNDTRLHCKMGSNDRSRANCRTPLNWPQPSFAPIQICDPDGSWSNWSLTNTSNRWTSVENDSSTSAQKGGWGMCLRLMAQSYHKPGRTSGHSHLRSCHTAVAV